MTAPNLLFEVHGVHGNGCTGCMALAETACVDAAVTGSVGATRSVEGSGGRPGHSCTARRITNPLLALPGVDRPSVRAEAGAVAEAMLGVLEGLR